MDGANCLEDLDAICTNIRETVPPINNSTLFPEELTFTNNLKIGVLDYRDIDIISRNTLIYVSSYVIQKCLEKHTC